MNELFYDEIMDQPEALRQSLPILRNQLANSSMDMDRINRIVFTGSGDSFIAAEALSYAARIYTSKEIRVLPSQEALSYWNFTSADLVIPISISGETKRTVSAAREAKKCGSFVLAITTNGDSSLASSSNEALLIPFRSRTRITPHSTDYSTTLLSIAVIIEKFFGHPLSVLDTLSAIVESVLNKLTPECTELGIELASHDRYYFFGVGPSMGTCLYGAAKFWEARGIRALPYELDEVGHGAHMSLEEGDVLFVPTTSGNSLSRIAEAIKGFELLKSNCVIITDTPGKFVNQKVLSVPKVEEEWSPFLTCLPMQLICWSVANAKGFDVTKDGRFASKDTYQAVLKHLRGE
jgi:glutamine---fructose-6-phosphate transaminase (isomerizing)